MINQENYLLVQIWMTRNLLNIVKKLMKFLTDLKNEGMPMSYHEHMGTIIQTENDVDMIYGIIQMIILFYFMTQVIYYLRKQTSKEY